jgi:hypothetical protein
MLGKDIAKANALRRIEDATMPESVTHLSWSVKDNAT